MIVKNQPRMPVEELLEHGQYAAAVSAVCEELFEQPENGRLWVLRGLAQYRLRNYAAARTAWERAGLLVPLDRTTQCLLASCYALTDRPEQAKSLYRHLADDPEATLEVLASVAAGFGQLADDDSALEMCRHAAARFPDCPEPLLGMAFYLRRLGYPASVMVPVVAKAFDLSKGELLYRTMLALLLAESGNKEEAYELLREVPTQNIGCACQLRRMMAVFQSMGDEQRWAACRGQLLRLSMDMNR